MSDNSKLSAILRAIIKLDFASLPLNHMPKYEYNAYKSHVSIDNTHPGSALP